jgi:hypothetical protein
MTNGNGQYAIGGYVSGVQGLTRAAVINTNDVINNYSDFSLFSWTKDSIIMNNYNGVLNSQQGTWGYSESKKFFDNNQPSYKFIGIIPKANHTLNNDTTINVNLEDFITEDVVVNTQKYNKEFIVAKTIVNQANYAQGATLAFEHQNSIVRIKFETANTNDLEILDFTPSVPAVPATAATETYTSKSIKFIDELVAGHEVQVGIGFYGVSSPKLTSTQPNPLYVGSDNTGNGWLAKTWLLSIKDAVNSQFVYYRLNQVNNSTSKTETTEDWESVASNKNIFMMKLADGVNATDFANGNDAFMNALTAHEADWVGGSPASTFKSYFQKAYDEGWRVIRINVSDANASQVLVFLSNNQNITTQVCEVTPGNPGSPAVVGKNGIVVLPATSAKQTGKDAVLSTFPETVTANIGMNGVTYTVNTTEDEIIFTKPGAVVYSVYSPTNWYTFPVTHGTDFGFTIKFSYKIDLGNVGTYVTRYDARVFVSADKCNWQPGKWYDYVIKVNSTKHGKANPEDADEDDPKIEEEFPIIVNSSVDQYTAGKIYEFDL